MWTLINTEFRYQFRRLISLTLFIPGIIAYILLLDKMVWYNIPFIVSLAFISQILIDRSNEGRRRTLTLLPVPVKTVGWVRLLLALMPFLLVWLVSFLSLYILLPAQVFGVEGDSDFLMFFGLILFAIPVYFIYEDLVMPRIFRKIKRGFASLSLIVIFSLFVIGLSILLFQVSRSYIVMILVLGLLLLYPTVLTFTRRRSYLR